MTSLEALQKAQEVSLKRTKSSEKDRLRWQRYAQTHHEQVINAQRKRDEKLKKEVRSTWKK